MEGATIGAIITAVLTIGAALIKWWAGKAPERAADAIQQGRRDLVDGNVDNVQRRIDGLLQGSSDSATGEPSEEDITRRLQDRLRR
jgi:hypothetical protein